MASSPSQRPPTIDPVAAARWMRRPATASPWLHEEVGRRMAERLQWIRARPSRWADWHPLHGGIEAHRLVASRYAQATAFVIEPTPALAHAARLALRGPWWRGLVAASNPPRFELPSAQGVDLLWSNMALHASPDPQALLAQWHGLLASDGFLMFSCLGPDTLRELGSLPAEMSDAQLHHDFTDMHDWGDMLVAAGFAEPVMDMERIVLTWPSADAALAELRSLGRNLHIGRFAGLRGRAWLAAFKAALARLAPALDPAVDGEGRVALTFEIVYGHAFKAPPRIALREESTVPLEQMRGLLHRKR